jgi:urease accessory protein
MLTESITQLRLLQLADSALPVGGASHSFGLETLVAEGFLVVDGVEPFLHEFLCETGQQESAFCRTAHGLIAEPVGVEDNLDVESWLDLNRRLSARKPAREGRAGSAALGRRLLRLVCQLEESPLLEQAYRAAQDEGVDLHYSTGFGLSGGALGLDRDSTVVAYLHQSVACLISACQRLLPLGQTRASQMLWNLKPAIVEASRQSRERELSCDEVNCFAPMLDAAAMRHATLRTRLFIS